MSGTALGPDRCPRCGGGFHCGVQDAVPCPCTTVTLPAELRASLIQCYTGCLCLACLQALLAERSAPGNQTLRTTTLPTE